jgi:hypothetical protein
MPPSLSLIETEASHLIGRMPETRRRALQDALVSLCETHWYNIRGPQPLTNLAQTLWLITPPLADLFIDLYARGDARLAEIVPQHTLARGLALLVLAEIEHGNEAGVHLAHEPMVAFETSAPPDTLLERITALLHGTLEPPLIHVHDKHGALWRALAEIAVYTRRLDLPAVLAVIRLLAAPVDPYATMPDAELDGLRHAVAAVGIRFLAIEEAHIRFAQHEHEHDPVRARELGEMLLELRQQWLE